MIPLTPEQLRKAYDRLDIFPPDERQRLLDELASTGDISDSSFARGGIPDPGMIATLRNAIIPAQPPPPQSENKPQDQPKSNQEIIAGYNKLIQSQGPDVANLTNKELQDRLSALQGISTTKGTITDPAEIGRELESALTSSGLKGEYSPALDLGLTNFVVANRRLPTPSEAANMELYTGLNDKTGNREKFTNFLNDQNNTNRIAGIISGQINPPPTLPADIKTVQDIISGRARKTAANADIMSFFEKAPGELATARQDFFDPQRARAKDYVQNVYAPMAKEALAARGLSNSGQVASSITSKYADLFGGITDAEAQQLVSDSNFFAQQSYDKTFSDLVNAGVDVRGTIAAERGRLRTEQLTGFAKAQSDIESKFNFDLFKEQARQAYDTYQKDIARKQDVINRQTEADLFGQAAQTATTIAIASAL